MIGRQPVENRPERTCDSSHRLRRIGCSAGSHPDPSAQAAFAAWRVRRLSMSERHMVTVARQARSVDRDVGGALIQGLDRRARNGWHRLVQAALALLSLLSLREAGTTLIVFVEDLFDGRLKWGLAG